MLEKKHILRNVIRLLVSGLNEVYKKTNLEISKKLDLINFKGLKFIEFPKLGFGELDKIVKKIKKLSGGVLHIDYGYLNISNKNTLQLVMKKKKIHINSLFKYLGRTDITCLEF